MLTQPLTTRLARLTLTLLLLVGLMTSGVTPASTTTASTQTDLIGPAGSGQFGKTVTALPNGNIVVTDPTYSVGATANVGAVYPTSGLSDPITYTWSAVTSPVTYTLASVSMASVNDGWAVGYYEDAGGEVYLHWDGNLWTNWWIDPSPPALYSVAMVSASDGWIVGSPYFGLIYRWDGNHWYSVEHPVVDSLKSVAMASADDGWAVGGGGNCVSGGWTGDIVRWHDNSWSLWATIPYRILRSVAMVSTDDGWAVGDYCYYSGTPPNSVNSVIMHWNGSNWSQVSSPTPYTLYSVNMLSGMEGWAVGEKGVTLHWTGSAWSQVSSPTVCDLRSVSMISADDVWAVGGGGYFCSSQSTPVILHWNGSVWNEVSSPVSQRLNSVTMISADEGWAVGEGGTILHYTSTDKLVRVVGVWTADYDWNPKTVFNPGAPLRLVINIENDTGGDVQIPLTYEVRGPNNEIVAYEQITPTTGTGIWWWCLDGTASAEGGTRTFTGSGLYMGTTSQASTTYSVVITPTITTFAPTSGPVGTSVTITGTSFSGATAVMFNGTSAVFGMISDTQLTATVPMLATTGPISVTTPGGTATSSSNFTVLNHAVYLPLICR
jgi:photosystem II stability/assembly factor-like uncharacterized protein